jgi:hypothetical protein
MKDVVDCDKPGLGVKQPYPGISEWGNPSRLGNQTLSSMVECIDHVKRTQRTETSKYLQESKSTETPLVAASESGYSPNQRACFLGLWALIRSYKGSVSRTVWKVRQYKVIVLYAKTITLRYISVPE